MAAKKFEHAMADIGTFLGEQPGPHDLEEIKAATGVSGQMAGKVLAALVDAKAVVLEHTDGIKRWAWISAHQTEPGDTGAGGGLIEASSTEDGRPVTDGSSPEPGEQESATTVEEAALTETADDLAGAGAVQSEAATAEGDGNEAEEGEAEAVNAASGDVAGGAGAAGEGKADPEAVPDPDPAVLLLAGQLAGADGPVGLEAITKAAFKVTGPKQCETALYALCALAEHGALTCSDPFAPDDRDREDKVEWTVSVDAAELDRVAAIVQLADAPPATVCPTCRTEIGLPHPKGTGRKRTEANARGDGRRRLADGELRQMLITLVKENPGEELKPSDFVRELKNDPRFKDRISANPSGAIRSALLALCKSENGEWVDLLDRTPQTFRCRDTH